MKEYKEKTQKDAIAKATRLNNRHKVLKNNQTWGDGYYKWLFSYNSIIVTYEEGHGNIYEGNAKIFLVKGVARKVGRNVTDLKLFNETEVCR